MDLSDFIRSIPDFPKRGIIFRDVTTLFSEPVAFKEMISQFSEIWSSKEVNYIAGIDARGFIIGGALAYSLGAGFVPLRKEGKLPYKTFTENYTLEYGTETLEIHIDAVPKGCNVLLVDDLIATGGTALAAINLLKQLKTNVIGATFLVDLPDLKGTQKISDLKIPVKSLCSFSGH